MFRITKTAVLLLLFINTSCSKEDTGNVTPNEPVNEEVTSSPTVETLSVEDIESFTANVSAKIIDNGGASVTEFGVCYSKRVLPNYSDDRVVSTSINGSGEYQSELIDLEPNTTYYVRAYALNNVGVAYGLQLTFNTVDSNPAKFSLKEVSVAGAHDVFLGIQYDVLNGESFIETGIAYGLEEMPTVNNQTSVFDIQSQPSRIHIEGLSDQTTYYFRGYTETTEGVYYTDQHILATIKQGNFTYTMNEDPNANAQTIANYDRIRSAVESAIEYYNNYTSIEKHVTVNYNPGTPTADANIDGWMNFGPNVAYQQTGTALHEFAHTVGVGTHTVYWQMMNGSWSGSRANEILQFMTDDPNALIYGDSMHFWPYGINGSWEDTGDANLYLLNTLIIQGMKTDGLPNSY